jgi:hypothetical protein
MLQAQTPAQTQAQAQTLTQESQSQVRDGQPGSQTAKKEQQEKEEEERRCSDEPNSPSSAPCYLRDFSFGSESESESDSGGHSHSHPHPYTHSTTSSTSSIDLSFASNHALPPTKLKLKPKPKPKHANGIEIENVGSESGSGRRYKCRTVGRSAGRANAKGRVRGMVESWERSGSEGEDVFGRGGSGVEAEASTSPQADGAQTQIPIQEQSLLGLVGELSTDHDDDGRLRPPPTHARAFEEGEGEKEEPSIETLLSQSQSNHTTSTSTSKTARAREDLDFSPSAAAAEPGRDNDITIKRVSGPSHSHSHSPAPSSSSSSTPGSISVSVPVLFHNETGDAFVDGDARRVSGVKCAASGSIVGWDDDDDDDSRDKDGRSTMKHLPVPPADDTRKKGNMRSHGRGNVIPKGAKVGTGSRRGKEREEWRVVTAIFSAEPHFGVVRGPVNEPEAIPSTSPILVPLRSRSTKNLNVICISRRTQLAPAIRNKYYGCSSSPCHPGTFWTQPPFYACSLLAAVLPKPPKV